MAELFKTYAVTKKTKTLRIRNTATSDKIRIVGFTGSDIPIGHTIKVILYSPASTSSGHLHVVHKPYLELLSLAGSLTRNILVPPANDTPSCRSNVGSEDTSSFVMGLVPDIGSDEYVMFDITWDGTYWLCSLPTYNYTSTV